MTPRRDRETQRAFVQRVLFTEGRIATYDVLYGMAYESGRKCSITRLAAIIFTLRHDGWRIDTEGAEGETSAYRLRYAPGKPTTPVPAVQRPSLPVPLDLTPPPVPEWAAGWRCSDCGSRPASEPKPMLGELARAFCNGCGASRYFRRAA